MDSHELSILYLTGDGFMWRRRREKATVMRKNETANIKQVATFTITISFFLSFQQKEMKHMVSSCKFQKDSPQKVKETIELKSKRPPSQFTRRSPTADSEDSNEVEKYGGMTLAELRDVAKSKGIKGSSGLKKSKLKELLISHGFPSRRASICQRVFSRNPAQLGRFHTWIHTNCRLYLAARLGRTTPSIQGKVSYHVLNLQDTLD
ncbi:transcription termination factor Rho [Striga asiatica]|uniref:Transcription termination factor Rho n=1 Tax=Striga asiatica TaxID=4170 RepID=A0A5A7QIB6_STRAF|nr:transcription termination factor Rho [Striga asiatica]